MANLTIPSDDPGSPLSVEVRGTAYLPTYTLTVSVTPSGKGSVTVNPPGTVFDEGTLITLTAEPSTGYHFDHWEGGLTGSTNPGQITLMGNTSVTAVFAINTYVVSTSVPGGHGSATPSSQDINHGSNASITITPDTGYHIAAVTDNGVPMPVANPYVITNVTAAHAVVVTFAINTYNVTPSAGAHGSILPSTPQPVNHGSTTSFTLTPDTGYHIGSVTGCGGSLSGALYTTGPVTANCTVTASFAINTYLLTATKTGTGSGNLAATGLSCTGSTCTGTYDHGSLVTITATPEAASLFTGWTGCDPSSGNTCIITLLSNKSVTATFILGKVLSVTKSGTGTGTVESSPPGISCGTDCTETVLPGASMTLTATPSPGSDFAYWTDGCSTTSTSCMVTLNSDITANAVFMSGKSKKVGLTVTKTKVAKGDGTVIGTDGRINCGPDCREDYYTGSPVTLTAIADPGSVFTGWSGTGISCPGTEPCPLVLSKDLAVKATFTASALTSDPDDGQGAPEPDEPAGGKEPPI